MTVELRAPTLDDVEELAAMFRRFDRAYSTDVEGVDELRAWFESPGLDMDTDARVAVRDGAIVAYGDLGDAGRDGQVVYMDVRPDPDAVAVAAPAVADFLETRAAELLAPDGVLKVWAPEGAQEMRELIESRGFDFDRYSFRMGIDLDSAPPEPVWPDGISLRPFMRETDTELVYEFSQEAFSEEPDHVRDPFDEWQHWLQREPFDPGLWFLAYADGELAGISLCRGERGGDKRFGWVHILAVRKPWRRKGLGIALLRHSFRELRERGKNRVGLGVDGASKRAVALYRKAGMNVEFTSAWYRKAAP